MNTDTTRQFWIQSAGQGEIVAAPLPPRQEGEVLVQALFSGISRGTESLVFRGEVPPSQYAAMRAPFQDGDFPSPVKYGYSSVGTVVEGDVELVGRSVFCLYPHQEMYTVPASAVMALPADVPPGRAVLAANAETALNAVWDAQPGPGDRIVVIGGGVVGMLTAWLCSGIPATDVVLVDVEPSRRQVAEALGVSFSVDAPQVADADVVFHASGQPAGLRTALSVAGQEATIVELSWYGDLSVSLPLGEAFHSRRLTVKSSQVGNIPPHRAPRWNYARRMNVALGLLADPRLDALITGESPFEELPSVLDRLSRDGSGTLCHRIRY